MRTDKYTENSNIFYRVFFAESVSGLGSTGLMTILTLYKGFHQLLKMKLRFKKKCITCRHIMMSWWYSVQTNFRQWLQAKVGLLSIKISSNISNIPRTINSITKLTLNEPAINKTLLFFLEWFCFSLVSGLWRSGVTMTPPPHHITFLEE